MHYNKKTIVKLVLLQSRIDDKTVAPILSDGVIYRHILHVCMRHIVPVQTSKYLIINVQL